ncbi:MAG: Na+/H+ antiporter [Solirubrobacterales bacterium]|nr:Na+/H+ antiporter [Solirubrobacterales bacterium]
MAHAEVLIALLGALVVLAGAARRLDIPSPIVLVAGGVGISLIPGLPPVHLESEVIFLVFLPPLLYAAGFNSSPRELRAQARHIAILAIGLVGATTAAVAFAVHLVVPGFAWPEAFVLGAILAPTDPVAAVAVMQRLQVAPRIASLVEGESLVNDGVGLVAYRVAVAATATGAFSVLDAGGEFVLTGTGGVAIGLAVGWAVAALRRRIDDPPVEIALSLFTPYLAYVTAEAAHTSGILAAVTVGLYLGTRGDGLFSASARLEALAFWKLLVFLLESTLFLLMGLQFAEVAGRIEELSAGRVALAVLVTALVVILLRLLWMYSVGPLLRVLIPGRPKEEPPKLDPAERLVVGWSGMRGAVSLAAALAIPATVDGGGAFPQRDLIVFVTFSVIVLNLVVQGLTLPVLIRRLGLAAGDDLDDAEHRARVAAAEAALAALGDAGDDDAAQRIRGMYESRLTRRRAPLEESAEHEREHAEIYTELREELLRAERRAVLELHERGELPDDALRRIQRDLDLEEARLS